MRYSLKMRKVVWLVVFAFSVSGTAQAYDMARIITSGKINVYRDGNLVQVLRENAPLPDGAVLKPEGNCGLRLHNFLMVAEDGSEFGVTNKSDPVQLALQKGIIHFGANQSTGRVDFQTPAGIVSAIQFRIQAAAQSSLKGFVNVTGATTTIGVLEGGSMVVSTPDGEQLISSGNQIILAQAESLDGEESDTENSTPPADNTDPQTETMGSSLFRSILIGGAATGLVLGGVALSDSESSSPAADSPFSP